MVSKIVDASYGKSEVKLFYVHRHDKHYHSVTDLSVSVSLTPSQYLSYLYGDNSDTVATDSTKNTIYMLANKHPMSLSAPENFGLLLCRHFMDLYRHINICSVHVESCEWSRVSVGGCEHSHAFTNGEDLVRFSDVVQNRDSNLTISSGIKDFKLLKTTQSGFENFIQDEYTSLKVSRDRILASKIFLMYKFDDSKLNVACKDIDYNHIWKSVKNKLIETFAGPPNVGEYSTSAQQTMYKIADKILKEVPEIARIEITMPNLHYFLYDLSKIGDKSTNNITVFYPTELPYGNINCKVERQPLSKL